MIKINNRLISRDNPPYIIAELSANHNGSILRAKESIEKAKKSGADAIKIQSYTPDTMTINCQKKDFLIKGGIWDGYSLYDLYKEAHTPFEWHRELFSFAKDIGITIFSSPFDETAVELLEDLNTPAYKIASFELCDIPLIKYIARKGKPILMSTGMADKQEIYEAVCAAKNNGSSEILLFHCISSYPTPTEEANLKNLLHLRDEFGFEVGLSDHTLNNTAAIAAVALGACAIEKHFTINKNDKGPDSEFSIEPEELIELKLKTHETWLALGKGLFERSKAETSNKIFRRSIYFVRDLKAGTYITKSDIKRIRPGYGLSPKFQDKILGKKIKVDVKRGDPVSWDVF